MCMVSARGSEAKQNRNSSRKGTNLEFGYLIIAFMLNNCLAFGACFTSRSITCMYDQCWQTGSDRGKEGIAFAYHTTDVASKRVEE